MRLQDADTLLLAARVEGRRMTHSGYAYVVKRIHAARSLRAVEVYRGNGRRMSLCRPFR